MLAAISIGGVTPSRLEIVRPTNHENPEHPSILYIVRRKAGAIHPARYRFLRALPGLLLVATAWAPLHAATLTDGFGPLALVKGERPVPGGCGRPLSACTYCAHAAAADTTMNAGMDMNLNMDMSGPVINSTVRLDAIGLSASPNLLTVTNVGTSAYSINSVSNPILTFVRGQTYTFNITANGHPFYIKTVQGNAYTNGVTGNGTQIGTVTFTAPLDAPNTLFYDCANHVPMTNEIDVINAVPEPSTRALLGLLALGAGGVALRRRRADG